MFIKLCYIVDTNNFIWNFNIFQNPICLLGLTACYDVLELLEERVKSRFSRRQFYLHNGAESGFKDRISLLSSLLKLPHRLHSVGVELNFINSWNKQITTILESKTLIDLLDQQYQINNSDTAFRNYLVWNRKAHFILPFFIM